MIAPKNPDTRYVGMIDMGRPIALDKLGQRVADGFDVFRVIFKKNKIEEAYQYIEELLGLGYEVFAQAVGTDNYSDSEFIELIRRFNRLPIRAFYIVDSFGLIKKKDFIRLAQIADHNLREDIMLGYHSHNNMQQAMGNAAAFTELNLRRDIVLDACVFGMGRGAGNLNLELFAEYMNENFGKQYRIEPMLEIIDEYLNDIYRKHFWGYSLPLYLSASNGCHPNYAIYFAAKGTLTVKSYNELLKSIPREKRAIYSEELAEQYYRKYQQHFVDDRAAVEQLEQEFAGREILLLGPGKTLKAQRRRVEAFIRKNDPLIVGLNFVPEEYSCDYAFICHMRRYKTITDKQAKRIITSNLREAQEYDYMLNFASYAADSAPIMENSGIMCLKFLQHLGISRVYIAGLDGYEINNQGNYVNSGLEYDFTPKQLQERNILIAGELQGLGERLEIRFLTESIYCQEK